jgi:hypothetical protein
MLKSYKVAIEGDRIKWLGEKPNMQSATGLIVIVEENKLPIPSIKRRTTSKAIAGKGRTIGDIVSPILDIATALEYQAKLTSIDSLFAKYSELANYLLKS